MTEGIVATLHEQERAMVNFIKEKRTNSQVESKEPKPEKSSKQSSNARRNVNDSAFGFDEPSDSRGFLLWQTTMLWQREIRSVLEPYHIAHAQFVIMAILLWFDESAQPLTQTNIIELSKLDKMTVSKSLKKLSNQGYVQRTDSQSDTRAKYAKLTAKGKTLVRTLVPKVEQTDADFFSILSEDKRHSFLNYLQALVRE